jgi:creatinine amidohydrolase
MNLPSKFWADLSSRQFSQLAASDVINQAVAVLPVAAIEQHGPHLPVSVDTSLVEGVIQAALPHLADSLPVLFLPTQQVGKSNEHIRYPGTLTLSAQTLVSVWMELGACVARAGIKKLVLFNSHGGQVSVMDIVARDLRTAHDLIVFSSNWFTLPLGEEVMNLFTPAEHRFGIHAGDMETSMMLALRERYVDMQHAQHFHTQAEERAKAYPILGNGSAAKLGWQMQDYNPYGAAGNATLATAAKGHAVIEAAGLQLARMLQEVSSLPLNTLNPQPKHSI